MIALPNVKKDVTKTYYNSQPPNLSQQSTMMNKHQNSRPRTQIRSADYKDGCRCPYDFDKKGNQCGGRAAYLIPGGSQPRCYRTDLTSYGA